MRRLMCAFSGLILAVMLCVPSFAATPAPYIPVIPKFLGMENGNPTFANGVTIDEYSPEVDRFFMNFSGSPHVILLTQEYKHIGNDASGIDYDRKFWIHYIRFRGATSSSGKPYNVGSFLYSSPTYSNPMRFQFNQNNMAAQVVSYFYDHEQNHLTTSGKVTFQTSPISFSYVIGSSSLSNTVSYYPNFNVLAGIGSFTVSSAVAGTDRHYNWWLSREGDITPPILPDDNLNEDTDGDGKPDINIDTDGDGKPDINIDMDGDKKPDINIDTDDDGKADTNIDSDGDGKPDTNLKPGINEDTDGDGEPDINIDTDGDGKPDINIDTNGDKKPDVNVDTDGDGKPDINIDTDGDKKPDINVDTDGDKKPDINIDTDGDKKPDINIDTNGDKKPDVNVDTDGDGKPDSNIDPDWGGGSGGSSSGGSSSGGSSSGGSSSGGSSSGGSSSGGSSSGGSSSDGSGSGGSGGKPPDWFVPDDDDLTYRDWNFFDPFKTDYKPFDWSWDYDPAAGNSVPAMPEIPSASIPSGYDLHDPFARPKDWAFGDYWLKFD